MYVYIYIYAHADYHEVVCVYIYTYIRFCDVDRLCDDRSFQTYKQLGRSMLWDHMHVNARHVSKHKHFNHIWPRSLQKEQSRMQLARWQ